jgi:3-isopropylmalate dehydrogenase
MKRCQIVLLPGDGIGPEVLEEGVKVLRAVERRLPDVAFEFTEYAVGAGEFARTGNPLPDAALAACEAADAVLLGAMGLPNVRWADGREIAPQIDLRERLQLYAGIRPVRLLHASDSPLKNRRAGEIDLVIVREQTEGLFASRLKQWPDDAHEVRDELVVSRGGAERVCRAAFELARRRRRRLTLVDKANVLPSMVFLRRIFDEVAADYPDVTTNRLYVDAAALFLVQAPESFDVLVTENMFGDILSDLTAALVGGMGMAPSADIGERCAVFQPAHGTAPDIAGRGIANPIATILSAAMLLDWLPDESIRRGASIVNRAVEQVLSNPARRTRDLGGTLSTREMGDAVAEAVSHVPVD